MFEIGRTYYVTVFISASAGSLVNKLTVIEVALPLVLFRDPETGAHTGLNVHSPAFVAWKLAEDE